MPTNPARRKYSRRVMDNERWVSFRRFAIKHKGRGRAIDVRRSRPLR